MHVVESRSIRTLDVLTVGWFTAARNESVLGNRKHHGRSRIERTYWPDAKVTVKVPALTGFHYIRLKAVTRTAVLFEHSSVSLVFNVSDTLHFSSDINP